MSAAELKTPGQLMLRRFARENECFDYMDGTVKMSWALVERIAADREAPLDAMVEKAWSRFERAMAPASEARGTPGDMLLDAAQQAIEDMHRTGTGWIRVERVDPSEARATGDAAPPAVIDAFSALPEQERRHAADRATGHLMAAGWRWGPKGWIKQEEAAQ